MKANNPKKTVIISLVTSVVALLCGTASAQAPMAPQSGGSAPMPGLAQITQTPDPAESSANTGSAGIQGSNVNAGGGSYSVLTRLQEENFVLDQQLKIAQKRKAIEALEAPPTTGPGTAEAQVSLAALAPAGVDPRVLLVQGRPGSARATIALPSGGTMMAGVGDMVPGVGTIVSVSSEMVIVRNGSKKESAIPFYNGMENNSNMPSGSGNSLPPPIPLNGSQTLHAPRPQ